MSTSIKDIFFQECEDLSDALTDGLNEMADGATDDETVNAVFRAVHSIKGSGGAFGLEDLVGFAHKFETVLDKVRSHELVADEKLMAILLRSGDVLIELIDSARNETPTNQAAVDATVAALAEFLPNEEDEVEVEFVFEPMVLAMPSDDSAPECDDQTGFIIKIRPSRNFYEVGNDPMNLIKALEDLGTVNVTADVSDVPSEMEEGDWESSYLAWTIVLLTEATEGAVRQIFDFVEDICDISIEPQLDSGASLLTDFNTPGDEMEDVPSEIVKPLDGSSIDASLKDIETTDTDNSLPKPDAVAAPRKPVADTSNSVPREAKATLRVDLERVDRLINAVGELIINQSVIAQRIEDAGIGKSDDLLIDLEDYKHLAREIQEGVMAIRAQPVKPLFQRMARIVREVTIATGKKVNLVTVGEGTEVDKTLVERLSDPLTHMVRNAIDHGVEVPEGRVSAGKPEYGEIRLSAEHRSGSVLIEISDDGAGLNRDRIQKIAVEKGIISPDADLSITEIDNLLFAPGFSTAAEVTNLSGRGVGMDVVKTAITALGGRIAISSVPGKGSTFSITLPLTLAVMDGMVVDVGEQTMVVPIASVLETIRPGPNDLSRIGVGEPLLCVRGEYVPVIDLAEALGHPPRQVDMADQVFMLVRTEKLSQCAFAVDAISDQRQVVIKSLQGDYGNITGVSAATILGDGKIALIIDPDGITSAVSSSPQPQKLPPLETTSQMEMHHA